jgi:hypothetical protein
MRITFHWIVVVAILCFFPVCGFGESQTITSSPVTLSNQPFVFKPTRPLKTPGHFTDLSIAIPKEYRLDEKTWSVRKQDGTEIKVVAKLTTTEGEVHDFSQVNFGYGTGKQYLNLNSGLKFDPKLKYSQISIISSEPITTDEIKWYSDNK